MVFDGRSAATRGLSAPRRASAALSAVPAAAALGAAGPRRARWAAVDGLRVLLVSAARMDEGAGAAGRGAARAGAGVLMCPLGIFAAFCSFRPLVSAVCVCIFVTSKIKMGTRSRWLVRGIAVFGIWGGWGRAGWKRGGGGGKWLCPSKDAARALERAHRHAHNPTRPHNKDLFLAFLLTGPPLTSSSAPESIDHVSLLDTSKGYEGKRGKRARARKHSRGPAPPNACASARGPRRPAMASPDDSLHGKTRRALPTCRATRQPRAATVAPSRRHRHRRSSPQHIQNPTTPNPTPTQLNRRVLRRGELPLRPRGRARLHRTLAGRRLQRHHGVLRDVERDAAV